MNLNSERKGKNLSKTSGVYLSAITIVFSVVLALLSLDNPIFLAGYLASTLSIAVITYLLRIYLSRLRTSERARDNHAERRPPGWKSFAPILLILIAIFVFPLFLAGFVDPYLWFILMISLAAGVSISQIVVYLRGEGPS